MFRHSLRDTLSVQEKKVPSRRVSGSREEGILQCEHNVYFAVTEMINLWPPATPLRSKEATESSGLRHGSKTPILQPVGGTTMALRLCL